MKKYYLLFIPLLINTLIANTITVSGKVLVKNTQQPIANVNIFHNLGGTISGESGEFTIELLNISDEITFSHIGYSDITLAASKIGKIDTNIYHRHSN